jgi:hypothetical protein
MTLQKTTVTTSTWMPKDTITAEAAGQTVLSFLDTATTSLGRATAYADRATQAKAELAAHEAMRALDRGLYALFLTLPGVSDRARQLGVKQLLGLRADEGSFLSADVEQRVLRSLVDELPPTRVLKLFQGLTTNNARTRKLVLRVLLGAPRIELWAVKYRRKMAEALTHAWGRRMASILRAILSQATAGWTDKERSIVRAQIDRFAPEATTARVRECLAFVLGANVATTLPLLVAYEGAKKDLAVGAKLPLEVLEGIRSVFHKETNREDVLRLTADGLTRVQRMTVQKKARAASIDVAMDPKEYDAVRLYLYAFEMGMTEEIARALHDKARLAASNLGRAFAYDSLGILVDASGSMQGGDDQKLRPMATVLALRDVLTHVGRAEVVTIGGHLRDDGLVRPAGDTSLAGGLLTLLDKAPDAIFVLSDGYENRAAGRFAEVVTAVRALGITTPIYHLNPVFAAESRGVRALCPGLVPTLPVNRPEALGLSFLRAVLAAEPMRGIHALVEAARPALAANV